MTTKKETLTTMKNEFKIICNRRLEICPEFVPNKHNDAEEFMSFLLKKITEECPNFEFVRHHLFSIFSDNCKYCNDAVHKSVKREIENILQVQMIISKDELLTTMIENSMKEKEIADSERWRCPECYYQNTRSFESFTFFKLPNVLVIQLKRYKVVNGLARRDNSTVHYERYMTLTEGTNTSVNYELIGLVVFSGVGVDVGHYYSYILHSTNQWYLINDTGNLPKDPTPPAMKVTAFQVLSYTKGAYLLFYRRCEGSSSISRSIIDMIVDCYGKNKPNLTNTNNVAVALKLPYSTNTNKPGMANGPCINIIKKFKSAKIKTLNEFRKFITENNLKLYFWRQVIYNKTVRDSCVDNGSCGFQLDFLLHWRATHEESNYKSNDIYMNKMNHIKSPLIFTEFRHYLNHLLYTSNTFNEVDKPGKNEDEWMHNRQIQYEKGELVDRIFEKESVYYKYLSFYNWLEINQNNWSEMSYPVKKTIRDVSIGLWYSTYMFNHTKNIHKYSLFQNTENLDYPHIPNYYILFYTTNCDGENDSYDYHDVELVAENLNHGALDNKGKNDTKAHYHLLPTFPLGKAFIDSLDKYRENWNFIRKYGEFPEKFEPLLRWGMPRKDKPVITRAYLPIVEPVTAVTAANNSPCINIEEIEQQVANIISNYFLEYDNKRMLPPKIILVKESNMVTNNPSHPPMLLPTK